MVYKKYKCLTIHCTQNNYLAFYPNGEPEEPRCLACDVQYTWIQPVQDIINYMNNLVD